MIVSNPVVERIVVESTDVVVVETVLNPNQNIVEGPMPGAYALEHRRLKRRSCHGICPVVTVVETDATLQAHRPSAHFKLNACKMARTWSWTW